MGKGRGADEPEGGIAAKDGAMDGSFVWLLTGGLLLLLLVLWGLRGSKEKGIHLEDLEDGEALRDELERLWDDLIDHSL